MVCASGSPAGSIEYLVVAEVAVEVQALQVEVVTGGYRESSGTTAGSYARSPLGACVSALNASS